jgi:hypothetical protein
MLSNDTSFALIRKSLDPVGANRLLRPSDLSPYTYDYTLYYSTDTIIPTIIRYIIRTIIHNTLYYTAIRYLPYNG